MNNVLRAKEIFRIEIETLQKVMNELDGEFEKAVRMLLDCTGKIVVLGMGKSGHIGAKIAATMASMGTPAFFIHPAEAAHGDLGMLTEADVLLLISNSGETDEIIQLIPAIKLMGLKMVLMTSNCNSTIAKSSDIVINLDVQNEACLIGVAPTSSTTAALVYGDALAVVLSENKGFTKENFGLFHPKGMLGKQLLLRVSDLMHSGNENPVIGVESNIEEALTVIGNKSLGIANIVDEQQKLLGIITSGDLVRYLEKSTSNLKENVSALMNTKPLTVRDDELAVEVIQYFKDNKKIIVVPVINEHDVCVGTLSVSDLIREKLM